VSIIGRGRLLAEGRVSEILAGGESQTVRVGIRDAERAAGVLRTAGFTVVPAADQLLTVGGTQARDPAQVTEVLAREGLFVHELTPIRADLESVFLQLTAEEHLGAGHGHVEAGPPDPGAPQAHLGAGPGQPVHGAPPPDTPPPGSGPAPTERGSR